MRRAAAGPFLMAVLLATAPPARAQLDSPLADDGTGVMAVTVAQAERGLCATGAPPLPMVELTIAQARAALLGGFLNCSALVLAHIQRIAAYNQPTQLNAVRAVHPGVLAAAAALDAQLAAARAGGAPLPPLFCVPLLIKDNVDVVGLATTAGVAALLDNFPAARSAWAVARLQAAGAVVLGKSNMGDFAFFPASCVSSAGGTVRNPYHLHRSPAGSSGGSAAGVAASLAVGALGTDTGNSIRGPASHTALVGLRPSLGLVGRSGIVPLRLDRDTVGPLARSVADAAALLEVMAGADPGDNATASLPAGGFNFTRHLDPGGLQGARVGVLTQIARLPGTHPGIRGLWEAALQDLQAAGAVLVNDFHITGNALGRDWDANRGGQGPALGHWNVGGRWEDLWGCQDTLRVGVDAYLGTAGSAVRSLEQLHASGLFHPLAADDLAAALREPLPPGNGHGNGNVTARCGCGPLEEDPCRLEFRARLVESMERARVSALVYPTWGRLPLLVGDPGDQYYDGNNSPMIAPHTGSPAISVPMGFVDGLPAGLAFLAKPFDEPALLRAAHAYERFTRHRHPPPLFKECVDPPPPPATPEEEHGNAAAGR